MRTSVLGFELYELDTKVTDEPGTNGLSTLVETRGVRVVGGRIIHWSAMLMRAVIGTVLVRNEYMCLILAKG